MKDYNTKTRRINSGHKCSHCTHIFVAAVSDYKVEIRVQLFYLSYFANIVLRIKLTSWNHLQHSTQQHLYYTKDSQPEGCSYIHRLPFGM